MSLSGRVKLTIAVAVLVTGLVAAGLRATAAGAEAGVISGVSFQDANRNGLQDPGEAPFANQQLYLFDGAMTVYYGTTLADASGRYEFSGLADGEYAVELEGTAWRAIRADWVPTTTGSVVPRHYVRLAGSATAHFGWRPIVRSSTFGSPMSLYVGPNGMQVESYNDVVSAGELYDDIMLGLVGPEAASVKVRFDFNGGSDTTTTAVSLSPDGRYERYGADVYAAYLSWLDSGDAKLIHEYGHAWSLYHAYVTQQDPTMASYLAARGVAGDSRLGSSHAWSPKEMIAEDYRQLFGPPEARMASQENTEIPPAGAVPGLREFLRDTYSTPPPATAPAPASTQLALSSLSVNPNPVRTSGTVSWSASAPANVTVTILNAKGAVVRTLLSGAVTPSGPASVTWDRLTDSGRRAAKGTYTAKVVAVDSGGASAARTTSFAVA